MGFTAPTPIQAVFIPAALAPSADGNAFNSRDLVGLGIFGTALLYGDGMRACTSNRHG